MKRFTTWGRTHTCTPAEWATPASEAEVCAIVQRAVATGKRVKVVGAGHSWSDAALTDGVMVSLDRMDRLHHVDGQRGLAVVDAGMRLRAFCDALADKGAALPIVGSVCAQSLGGLLATGTHGSSLRHGNLSSGIVAMRIVNGRGEVVELLEGDPRLRGARIGLGGLGIVTRVTLRTSPAFIVAESMEPMTLDEALARLPTLGDEAEFAKLWWIPHIDLALVFKGTRVTEPPTFSERFRTFDEHVVNGVVFRAMLALGNRFPGVVPFLNRLVAAAYFRPRRVVGRSDRVLSLAMPPVHREAEWAVPKEHGATLIRRARDFIASRRIGINFILEARFVKADDTWMSPAHGRDSIQFGAYSGWNPHCPTWYEGVAAIARDLDGRLHWGKEGVEALDPITVRRMYPRADDFAALVRELDPDGVFRNVFIDRIVGPSPHP